MFEAVKQQLETELDIWRQKRQQCEALMEVVTDKKRKVRLSTSYDIICHALERVALCLDILDYRVSVQFSEDYSEVRLPKIKEVGRE